MRIVASFTLVTRLASAVLATAAAARLAQTPRRSTSTTTTPPATSAAPRPGMPLAPRLQNLGVHTFPVSTNVERAQLFINQGLNLAYGFNHAEAGARVRRSGAARSALRDGVLGPGARARAEHQRADGRRRTSRRRSSWCRRPSR